MEGFHIDRCGIITIGQVNARDTQGSNEKAMKLKKYPCSTEKVIEDAFEKCRAEHCPKHLSRLKAFYVTDRFLINKWIKKMKLINNGIISGNLSICTVEVNEQLIPYDAMWLDFCRDDNNKPLEEVIIHEMAYNYWSGKMTDNPLVEGLCPFPVKIKRTMPINFFDIETENEFKRLSKIDE